MILLCSNGLTSAALTAELSRHVHGGTAALVVTADGVYKEKNYHVPQLRRELEALGFSVDLFDIDTEDASALLCYDLVEFMGGDPFYLLSSIRRKGAESVLETLAREKLLIGISAAAVVFGPTLALMEEYTPELNTAALTDLRGLSLTHAAVLPHYSRYLPRFDRFEERCALFEKQSGLSVLRISDGDAVLDRAGDITVLRAEASSRRNEELGMRSEE